MRGSFGRAVRACALAAAALGGAGAAQPPDPDQEPDQAILVTGSRIARPGDESPSPIETVRPESFRLTGVANVEQTLNQLPQLVPSFTTTSNNPGTGAATLDLRGLGSVRTLVLVNGRRWIADDAGQVPEVDVNTIPAALIERVDVATGGASAAYGSDAVTGVVNFVLKDRLEGLHLDARQSLADRGDGRVSSADLSFGLGTPSGRGRLLVSAGWLDQAPITQGGRLFSTRSLTDGCAVTGTRSRFGDSLPVADPACPAPFVVALTAGGSATIPGSRIPGVFLPVAGSDALLRSQPGIRFDPDGTPRPFVPATDRYNFAPGNYLQIGFRRFSANAFGALELSPALTPYFELSWVETRSPQQLAPVAAMFGQTTPTVPQLLVNLDNPFLTADARRLLDISFGRDAEGDRGFAGSVATGFRLNPAYGGDADGLVALPVLVTRLEDLGPRQIRNRRDAGRALIGLRGGLGGEWRYDLFLSGSRVTHSVDFANSGSALRLQQALLALRDPAGGIVCRDPSAGCVPANIFGPGNLGPGAADFIRTHPRDHTRVDEEVAEGSLQGSLPWLAAGRAELAVGASWRRSAYRFTPDPALFTGDDLGFSPGVPAAGSTEAAELFGEARLPLLAALRFARELNLELGLRASRYDTVGLVWTWKAMGQWVPFAGLRLRGGYQRAVRAPNVRELHAEPTLGFDGFVDPCSADSGLLSRPDIAAACLRNGIAPELLGDTFLDTGTPTRTSGNPRLRAETAGTFTIGLTAELLRGFSSSIDYYDIAIRDAIGRFGGGAIFTIPGCILSGADPANPLCAAYSRSEDGTILSLAQPSANLPGLRSRGIDWRLGWRGRAPTVGGTIELSTSGTYYFENGFRPNAEFPRFDCAGLFGAPCGATIGGSATPRWKLLDQLAWSTGAATFSLRHRWFSATRDARTAIDRLFGFAPRPIAAEGRRLEGRHYFDLAATFRAGETYALTIGVNNLADRKPALTGANQVQANTDPSLYDVIGRRLFVALSAALR